MNASATKVLFHSQAFDAATRYAFDMEVTNWDRLDGELEKITREQFIVEHLGDGRLSRTEWDRYLVAVECDCGEDFCHGWRAMPKTEWKWEARRRS